MQADALLKLQKHEDADSTMSRAPELGGMDEFTKFFGATANSYFLMIQAQVEMAAGRLVVVVRVIDLFLCCQHFFALNLGSKRRRRWRRKLLDSTRAAGRRPQ